MHNFISPAKLTLKHLLFTREQAFENLNAAYKEADDAYDKALRDFYAAGDVKSAAYIAAYKAYEAVLVDLGEWK